MRAARTALLLGLLAACQAAEPRTARDAPRVAAPPYTVAFASFGPLDAHVFLARADGSEPRRLLPAGPGQDYNASFSADGAWIVFTSDRKGSADVYEVHPDGTGLRQLTDHPAFDDQGSLSPDGKRLAFVSSRSGQADIWILELATGGLRNLTNDPAGDFRPSWSPNGDWIAFSSDRDSKKPKFTFATLHSTEIYVIHPDGSGLRRITRGDAFAGSPSWSPDGARIAYYEAEMPDVQNITSPRRLRGTTQIVSLDLTTNERRVHTTGSGEKWSPRWLANERIGYASGGPEGGVERVGAPAGARGEVRSPSWSSDGEHMVFHRDLGTSWPPVAAYPSRDPGFRLLRTGIFPSASPSGERVVMNDQRAGILHNQIVVMDSDGSHRAVLFGDPARSALAPAWSPRGDLIAFGIGGFFQSSQGAALADIAVMRADGTGVRVLTDGAGNYGFPSWSPDGRRIVYRASGHGRSGLFVVDVVDGHVAQVSSGEGHDNFPAWSPTGDRIAFTSARDGGDYEIYSAKADGTDVKRLTNVAGNEAHSAWSPDGMWIAFTSARGGFKDESVLHPYNPQPYGELYVMRADGSDVRQLTDDPFEEGTPAWIPSAIAAAR